MSHPVLGKTPDGKAVHLDVDRLVASRMLLQANSGGGKSWALRRILEQTHGRVQHLILDIEGEFHTLRERFDYVLAARTGGDTLADVRTAPLLARRLLELGVSSILDLYDLKAHERVLFVRRFLEALVEAPKDLWHPCLVVVDEAHHFCPQSGSAESAGAVIDLMTRGRKRGFCGLLATQRLSKLHKDAAAEANVKLIGRAALDVDMKRAAEELGLTSREDLARIRTLEPGHFFAFGPGLSDQVVEVVVGDVETTHPKAGARQAPVPPPREKVKRVLGQLADLPKEAEVEITNLAAAKERIRELERIVRAKPAPPAPAAPKVQRVEVSVLPPAAAKAIAGLVAESRRLAEKASWLEERAGKHFAEATRLEMDVRAALKAVAPRPACSSEPKPARLQATTSDYKPAPSGDLDRPQQRILDTIATLLVRGLAPNRECVARWQDLHPNSGSYGANLGRLRAEGYLDGFRLTEKGEAAAHAQETGFDALLAALPDEPKRSILRTLDQHGAPMSREEVAAALNLHPNGGSYGANLGWLRTMQVITERGPIALTAGATR